MKLLLPLLVLANISFAANVAVVDTGVDIEHRVLADKIWTNPLEQADGLDNDNNGRIDDLNGWNFVSNNDQLINRNYMHLLYDEELQKFMGITQSYPVFEEIPKEELEWMRDTLQKRPGIFGDMQTFGAFTHGTHVAGIVTRGNPDVKIMPIKYLPTDMNDISDKVVEEAKSQKIDKGLFSNMKRKLAEKLIKSFIEEMHEDKIKLGKYINETKMDISNGSYGTSFPKAQGAAQSMLERLSVFAKPKQEDIDKVARTMLSALLKEEAKFVDAAPNTLFIYAAGNDGMNNDIYPSSSNIFRDNYLTVAATDGRKALAKFSNYGVRTVDIAAPGVNINSTIPGDGYMKMSGTSQAAPYVSNVASRIKDINRSLTPKDIKAIIMRTGDKKDFLKDKVRSGAMINAKRALKAAKLSLDLTLDEAIQESLYPSN